MVKIEHYTVLCRQRRIVNGLLAYNLQEALLLQAARATRFVSQKRYSHSSNYCDDHCSPCSAESLHHYQKSTSSRYYRLTRLHVRSIDSIDRLDLSRLTLSIDSTSVLIDGLDRSISRSTVCIYPPPFLAIHHCR